MASFYVAKSGSNKWRVMQEVWKDGKPKQATVPKEAYTAMGINPTWSIDQARKRIRQINSIKTREKTAIAAATKRVVEAEQVTSDFLPADLVLKFTAFLKKTSFGSETHQAKIVSHWNFVQHMIANVQVEPTDYAQNALVFHRYFLDQKVGLDYSRKLLRILNLWGEFVSRDRRQFFTRVKGATGNARQKLVDVNAKVKGRRRKSDALTPEVLKTLEGKLDANHYNWLSVSVWYGLRPEEIDQLTTDDDKLWTIEFDAGTGVDVLWVYQTKLTAIAPDKRWKGIPIFLPQQEALIDAIKDAKLKRPRNLKLRELITSSYVTCYGGRNGFEDLMTSRYGQTIKNVSRWMGHQSLRMTTGTYTDKQIVSFDSVKKVG